MCTTCDELYRDKLQKLENEVTLLKHHAKITENALSNQRQLNEVINGHLNELDVKVGELRDRKYGSVYLGEDVPTQRINNASFTRKIMDEPKEELVDKWQWQINYDTPERTVMLMESTRFYASQKDADEYSDGEIRLVKKLPETLRKMKKDEH